MKKYYPLTKGKHAPARVIDGIKSNVRKHVTRERGKELPQNFDFWDFSCRVGETEEDAVSVHLKAIGKAIDEAAAKSTSGKIFVAIEAVAKRRNPPRNAEASKEKLDASDANEGEPSKVVSVDPGNQAEV